MPEGWAASKGIIMAFLPIAMPAEGGNVEPDLRLPLIPSE